MHLTHQFAAAALPLALKTQRGRPARVRKDGGESESDVTREAGRGSREGHHVRRQRRRRHPARRRSRPRGEETPLHPSSFAPWGKEGGIEGVEEKKEKEFSARLSPEAEAQQAERNSRRCQRPWPPLGPTHSNHGINLLLGVLLRVDDVGHGELAHIAYIRGAQGASVRRAHNAHPHIPFHRPVVSSHPCRRPARHWTRWAWAQGQCRPCQSRASRPCRARGCGSPGSA